MVKKCFENQFKNLYNYLLSEVIIQKSTHSHPFDSATNNYYNVVKLLLYLFLHKIRLKNKYKKLCR